MGWLFTGGASRKDIIEHVTRREENDERVFETLAKTCRGNNLWTVQRVTRKRDGSTSTFICLYKLGSDKGFGWGYKDITESMGPYDVSCPLAYLDLATDGIDADWREKVVRHNAQRELIQTWKRRSNRFWKGGSPYSQWRIFDPSRRHMGKFPLYAKTAKEAIHIYEKAMTAGLKNWVIELSEYAVFLRKETYAEKLG